MTMVATSGPGRLTQAARRARTRSALLEAAARGLSRDGYANLVLERVAREAGYTRGALYHLFANKEDLALAVVGWVEETWFAEVGHLLADDTDPVGALVALARGHAVYCRRDVARVMMNLAVEFSGQEHPVGRAVESVGRRIVADCTRLISAGRRSGAIPPGPAASVAGSRLSRRAGRAHDPPLGANTFRRPARRKSGPRCARAAAGASLDGILIAMKASMPHSRPKVACHLRFGAEALLRMTRDALAGKETAYYPRGRERQRPATLEPRPAESPQDVVESLAHSSQDLDDVWRLVGDDAWETPVVEPAGNPVLGTLPLHRVTLMRWTEVEVHGTDLGLGLSDWSDDFVTAALPMRLAWLNTRRTNHRAVDESVQGAWLLEPTGNEAWLVRVDGTVVSSSPAIVGTTSDVTFSGSSRDLLAPLLR